MNNTTPSIESTRNAPKGRKAGTPKQPRLSMALQPRGKILNLWFKNRYKPAYATISARACSILRGEAVGNVTAAAAKIVAAVRNTAMGTTCRSGLGERSV